MTYAPQVFPVQVVKGQTYDPGTNGRGNPCRADFEPWWTSNTFVQQRGTYQHNAIDIMAPLRAKVVAPVSGRVLEEWTYRGDVREGVDYSEAGGWNVKILGDDGNTHFFSHMLERPLVRPGQRVRAGQQIGLVGQTGNAASTCPHLHYQVRDRSGAPVNPIPRLQELFDAGGWLAEPSRGWLWLLLAAALLGGGYYLYRRRSR